MKREAQLEMERASGLAAETQGLKKLVATLQAKLRELAGGADAKAFK